MTGRRANSTLAHYDAHAGLYADLLADHDSAPARQRFLAAIARPDPAILDLGCGAGRDLAAFRQAGAHALGADGSATLVAIAAQRTGCAVATLDLLSGDPAPWGGDLFDGIWAHHLFFHLPSPTLPLILNRVAGWLRPGGVLYACDPTGDGLEGMTDDGRFLAFRHPQSWKSVVSKAGFALIADWRRPENLPRRRQEWLATLWQRL